MKVETTLFPQIDGIAVEVIHATVFFRCKWAVVMLDTSAACTIGNSLGIFNF